MKKPPKEVPPSKPKEVPAAEKPVPAEALAPDAADMVASLTLNLKEEVQAHRGTVSELKAAKEKMAAVEEEFRAYRGEAVHFQARAALEAAGLQAQLDAGRTATSRLVMVDDEIASRLKSALDAALEVINMCNTSTCPREVLDRLKVAREKIS